MFSDSGSTGLDIRGTALDFLVCYNTCKLT